MSNYVVSILYITLQESRAAARKPRRKCSFLLKFANNIHYKYKTSQASKADTLQSSKHADA